MAPIVDSKCAAEGELGDQHAADELVAGGVSQSELGGGGGRRAGE